MLTRRDLLSGAVIGSAAPSQPAQSSERSAQEIAQAINNLRSAITAPQPFPEISRVRTKQIEFLRGQGKLPDFIELGIDAWFAVYDWHVRHLQPIALGRDPSGRYTIALMTTTLIMRVDADQNFVGVPYDTAR
jgi:hypothetical protein